MALTASSAYENTVVADTANTNLSSPTSGSYKTVAVGSASGPRTIEEIDWSAVGDTTKSALTLFLYDSGSTKAVIKFNIDIPTWDTRMDKVPIIPPAKGPILTPKMDPITLADNTWSLIAIVQTSQEIRINTRGKNWT